MRIVVCVKQVPDTTEVRMDPERSTLIREGVPSIVNPFDAFALELALSLADEDPDIEVITLSMGPPQAEESLRETIGMGADSAILVSDAAFAGSDTWATSFTLSAAIREIGDVDLILTGQQAIDGDTAQVGPGIARFLGIPQGIFVRRIELVGDGTIRVERVDETGHQVVEMETPALVSVIKLSKDPRLPSLRGMMKAKKAEIPVWDAEKLGISEKPLGLDGSPTRVCKIFTPPQKGAGEMWEGEPREMGEKHAKLIKEKKLA